MPHPHRLLTAVTLGSLALDTAALANDPRASALGQWRTSPVAIPAPIPVLRPAIGTWVTSLVPASPQRPPLTTASLPRAPLPSKPAIGHELAGIASFYWQDQMTASGERFDRRGLTAAHRTLPFGTRIRVTHMSTGQAVTVRVNDRGPFKPGRIIDLSEAAAEAIGMVRTGLAPVMIEIMP